MKGNGKPRVDRLPPHSSEAEQAVLGCILLDFVPSLAKCAEYFRSPEVFYDLRHQTIYGAILDMISEKVPVDTVTLAQWLKDKQSLDDVGGISYIAGLPDCAPTAMAIEQYIQIVHDKFLLRSMVRACGDAVTKVYDYEGNVPAIIDQVERDILRVRQSAIVTQRRSVRELVDRAMSQFEEMGQKQGQYSGLPTGFPDLDKLTWGFQNGEMIVIAARPSLGKTSLAMNFAEKIAIDDRNPVGIFSLEMTADSLIQRMICCRARVNMRNIREGFLAERDIPKISSAAGKIRSSPIYIDDSSGISVMQLRAKARRMWQEFGIKLFVIDYLQLLNNNTNRRRDDNRQQEVADISAGIKSMAKEMSVPVIVISQLNRDIERDKFRRPRLSDIRESGAVEQDADIVGILYNAKNDDDDTLDSKDAIPVNLLIAKNRNGPADEDVRLTFLKSFTRFESAAKISNIDIEADRQADMNYNQPYPE